MNEHEAKQMPKTNLQTENKTKQIENKIEIKFKLNQKLAEFVYTIKEANSKFSLCIITHIDLKELSNWQRSPPQQPIINNINILYFKHIDAPAAFCLDSLFNILYIISMMYTICCFTYN